MTQEPASGVLPALGESFPLLGAWQDYVTDAIQRTILTADVLRRRGNRDMEHVIRGKPPVLAFDYDLVMDGATLPRPTNYLLLRIRPPADRPTDPLKRPMVVVDPRAGHGPGIGGFKADSQIGLALSHGYPCYFVSFRPRPVPGQTLEDVAHAEAAFLDKVASLHPEAGDRPVVIGNCQAGWAVAILSAAAPSLMSVVILNGAPLSYWSGVAGRNPMRYLGGLWGGTWLAALASDMGHDIFDGAYLVSNFEYLDPANTWVKKPYNLYSKVDTEAERFLEFERWWGGHFLLTGEEMRFITSELFVGNKLVTGAIEGSGGVRVDLRNVRAPVVVFASKGDNITPPQQALNWILDVYESVDDIKANNQVIIYLLHDSIGHLGIFVSSRVARREHRAIVDSLDLISTLPPGLYEMKVAPAADGGTGWDVRFEKRGMEDLGRLDDSRRDELLFLPVASVSELNNRFYEAWLGPLVRQVSNEATAEWLRRFNPTRLRRWSWSDLNPLMAMVAEAARDVRAQRRPADADNPFRIAEKQMADLMAETLDHWRDLRDAMVENAFLATYMPLRTVLRENEDRWLDGLRRVRAQRAAQARQWLERDLMPRMAEGGVADAAVRALLWLARHQPAVSAHRFRLAEQALARTDAFAHMDPRQFRDCVRRQFQLLDMDSQKAIAALPRMLADPGDRAAALGIIGEVAAAVHLTAEESADLESLRALLETGTSPSPPKAERRGHRPGAGRSVH